MKQIPLALAPDVSRSFDSFVVGANAMALEHLLAFHAGSAPVYLWGPSGSGKTHLLQALAQRFQQQGAFALFVDATTRGIPIAAAGRVPPVDLPLRDDLRTRLGWGHVLAIQPLSEAESRAALRREA